MNPSALASHGVVDNPLTELALARGDTQCRRSQDEP
jgi:hypothetical protein